MRFQIPSIPGIALAAALLAVAPASPGLSVEGASDADRLARAELLAGLTPVEGPGLVVTLRNSPRTPPRGADPKNFKIHEQDVHAVLNSLRAAGCEALGLGGRDQGPVERVLGFTACVEIPSGIEVHGVRMAPPYRILAIGDSKAMRADLFAPRGAVRRSGLDTLQMIVLQDAERVALPAGRPNGGFKFARAADPIRIAAAPPIASPPTQGPVAVVRRSSMPPPPTAPVNPPPVAGASQGSTPASRPALPASGAIFGGKGLTKYHASGCRFGERIEAVQRQFFETREEAAQAGRTPCQICSAGGPAPR